MLFREEGYSPLFLNASRVKLISRLEAPVKVTTSCVHDLNSLIPFSSVVVTESHEQLIPFSASSRLRTAKVGSSILPGRFKVQWHTLGRWFANVEIDVRLFVAFGVLLSPQYQEKRRKLRKDNLRPVDLRVTSRTESDHQMQQRLARFPMMDSGIGITAHPTGVSIAL